MTALEPRTNLRPNVGLNLPESGHTPATETRAAAETLTAVVRNAVRGVDQTALSPVARRDSGAAFQPSVLLAIMTCCYAREIFGSADIERLMRRDAAFRGLCGNEFPDAQTLRRFRRQNRPALQECLEVALSFLVQRPDDRGKIPPQTVLSVEAIRRLDMAACMDTLQFDP